MRSEKLTVIVYTDSSVFIAEVTYGLGSVDPAEFEPYDLGREELADKCAPDDWPDFGVTGLGLTSLCDYASGAEEDPLRRALYDAPAVGTDPQSTYRETAEFGFAADEDLEADADFAALEERLTAMSDFSYDGDVYDATSRAIANLIILLIISLWLNQ